MRRQREYRDRGRAEDRESDGLTFLVIVFQEKGVGAMRKLLCLVGVMTLVFGALAVQEAGAQTVTLRYAHMNAPSSIAGQQAAMLAKAIEEKTKGAVKVNVFPSSQLGT